MHDQRKPNPPQIAPIESVLLPDFCKPEYLAQYLGIPLKSVVAAIESGEIRSAGSTDIS